MNLIKTAQRILVIKGLQKQCVYYHRDHHLLVPPSPVVVAVAGPPKNSQSLQNIRTFSSSSRKSDPAPSTKCVSGRGQTYLSMGSNEDEMGQCEGAAPLYVVRIEGGG